MTISTAKIYLKPENENEDSGNCYVIITNLISFETDEDDMLIFHSLEPNLLTQRTTLIPRQNTRFVTILND